MNYIPQPLFFHLLIQIGCCKLQAKVCEQSLPSKKVRLGELTVRP